MFVSLHILCCILYSTHGGALINIRAYVQLTKNSIVWALYLTLVYSKMAFSRAQTNKHGNIQTFIQANELLNDL